MAPPSLLAEPTPIEHGTGAPCDPDVAWLRRSVRFVACAMIVGLGACLARDPTGFRHAPLSSALLAAGIVVAATAAWINGRGHSRRAAQLLAFTLPVLAAVLALGTGRGFRDPAILIMPATLILCGVLLDRHTLIATTAVTVGATVGVIVAEGHGLVAPRADQAELVGDVVDSLVILGITSVGVGIVAGQLRESLGRLVRQDAALRASEARYRGLVDLAADAIVVSIPGHGIAEANRRAETLTGFPREELLGRPLRSLFSPAELARAPFRREAVERGETVVAERTLTRRDGGVVPVEMSSKQMPDGSVQSILRDVSERRRAEDERRSLESQLRQAQKMEAIGRLAGGIAHDFNNLLTAMTGSLTLALRGLPEDAPARRWLAEVDRSAWRAASLTRRLLAFSRRQVIEPKVLDLRSVAESAGALVARTIGEDVKLEIRLAEEPVRVEVDQSQLEQILLNLATNARDAMLDGGKLTIEVGWAAPALPSGAGPRPDGRRIACLSVADTGHGIDDEVMSRIFEPFFTTKPHGSGTGLGLAMVYGAVVQHGGWIDVESAPGRGATFRVFFPEASAAAEAAAAPEPEPLPGGTETVLLVEDEEAVREVTTEQLESLGYRVLPCAGAKEALAVAARHEGPLDLLFTDVVMPEVNGRELAVRLKEARPAVRVLFTSGYGADVIGRHGVLDEGVLLLQKPYSLLVLARKIRQALAA